MTLDDPTILIVDDNSTDVMLIRRVKPVEFDGLLQMLKTVNLYWLMLNERRRFNGQ